jgi:hypothetical protein
MKPDRSRKVPITIYVSLADLDRIDKIATTFLERLPGSPGIARSDAGRAVVTVGLETMEGLLGLCANQPSVEKRYRPLKRTPVSRRRLPVTS